MGASNMKTAFVAFVFAGAAFLHAGVLARGYEHAKAQTAEGVISAVLIVAFAASLIAPSRRRSIGLVAQWGATARNADRVVHHRHRLDR